MIDVYWSSSGISTAIAKICDVALTSGLWTGIMLWEAEERALGHSASLAGFGALRAAAGLFKFWDP